MGAVRERLGPRRLLPLGEAADGVWLAEGAARRVLLRAVATVRGVVPGTLRVGLAEEGPDAPFPVPPGGLPPGRLRIAAEFATEVAQAADRPLLGVAEEVRGALFASADRELGLVVVTVDLRVTGLAERAADSSAATPPVGRFAGVSEDPAAHALLGIPGIAGLTSALGSPVHRTPGALRMELAVAAGHRALDVARAARARAAETAPEGTAVTVLVSEIQ